MTCKNCGTQMIHKGDVEMVLKSRGEYVERKLPPFECPGCKSIVYWSFLYNVPGWGDVEWDIVNEENDDSVFIGCKYNWRSDEGGWVPAGDYTKPYDSIEAVKQAIENGRQWDQEDQFDPRKGGLAW